MEILRVINPAHISEEEAKKFKQRHAARGIVFDGEKNVAVLPVGNHNYYKLPGGGVESGESNEQAFKRECLEEIGFDVEIIAELGIVIEYRTEFSIMQTSYCYIGKAVGSKKEIALTVHEMGQGFKDPEWVSFEEAFSLISTSEPNNYEGEFIRERDTLILETAQKFV